MDFKKEIVKELGLGAIAEETMLDDYVKACEAIAVRYHESKVVKLGLFGVRKRAFKRGYKKGFTDGQINQSNFDYSRTH